ncbi:MAG TPA: AI-2E family transporter [Chloroflexota bacterium]|nr:AI-2E family transporter [Chloroflexota bacterium]
MVIRDPWIRALVIVMLSIAGLYLAGLIWQMVSQFADIILLFFLAWVVAFILEPLVVFLRLHARLPRPVAVTAAYVGLLLLVLGGVVWVVPPLSRQVVQLAVDIPIYASVASEQAAALQDFLDDRGLPVNLASLLNYDETVRRIAAVAPPILSNAVALATNIASFFLQLAIVLILSFYVMLDGHRISRGLLATVPTGFRDDVAYFFASVNRAFAGFMRGQLIQSVIFSLGVAAIMWIAGTDLILLTTVVTTLLMLIPFVGPILALVMPLAIIVLEMPGSFWLSFIAINALQQVVLNVVAPRVMSTAVGLHPLLVFVGLLVGARVAGFWGALFGVPAMAVITAMVSFYHAMLEQRRTDAAVPSPEPEAIETSSPVESGPPVMAQPESSPVPGGSAVVARPVGRLLPGP